MKEETFREAIRQYKTPFYLFDTDLLADQVKKIRDALGQKTELYYAMKANPFLIKELEGIVDSFEVCSPGEFRICQRADIPGEKIVLSGVYKNPEDLETILNCYEDRILYTVESLSHWQILQAYASKHRLPLRVLLRLTSGNQFGMEESLIRQLIEKAPHDFIEIEGIQFFSGTQKKNPHKLESELNRLDSFCIDLKEQYGFTVKKLEYGPGLPICYFEDEKEEEETILLNSLAALLKNLKFGGKVALELGRFIAAPCGSYVTSVVDQKVNMGTSYCIVDGGIHHLNYYGQVLAMKKPSLIHWNQREGEIKEWTVCGSLCTVGDVLVKQYPFKELQTGDQLIFEKTGAYSVTEGISLFLSRDLPQVLLYSEKDNFRRARKNFPTDSLNYF